MWNINLVENFSVDISIHLPITIEVPEPLAQRLDHLLDNRAQTERDAVLTTYLIQKCFITSVRGLLRAGEICRDLKQCKRTDDLRRLQEIVSLILAELYAFRTLDLNGKEIASNTRDVQNLFSGVCGLLSGQPGQEDSERILKDLQAYQIRFVEILVQMIRDHVGDFATTGVGSFHQKIEQRLMDLERQNFANLVRDYELVITGSSDNKVPLPDIPDKQLTRIEDSIREQLRADVENFRERDAAQLGERRPRDWFRFRRNGRLRDFFRFRNRHRLRVLFGFRRNDQESADVFEREKFLISVRESIRQLQKLVILRSALDKVHMFYAVLEGISCAIRASQSNAKAEAATIEEVAAIAKASTLTKCDDLISKTMATAYQAVAKLSSDHALREKGHKDAGIEMASHLSQFIALLDLRNGHTRRCLVALSTLAHYLRVYHPAFVNEAGEKSAPQTAYILSRIVMTLNMISASQEQYQKDSSKAITFSSV